MSWVARETTVQIDGKATLSADFVQLREADGTERFVPLSRVEVVVGR